MPLSTYDFSLVLWTPPSSRNYINEDPDRYSSRPALKQQALCQVLELESKESSYGRDVRTDT